MMENESISIRGGGEEMRTRRNEEEVGRPGALHIYLDRVLRSAARLIGHIPKYASVSAYTRDGCTGSPPPNAFCIGFQHLSGDL